MTGNKKRRLEKLEKSQGEDVEITVEVNWCDKGYVLDKDTNEEVTVQEWKRRHPDRKLILVGWDEDGNDKED